MSSMTSIRQSAFGLQMLSAPGLSGSVVTTEQGHVVGIVGGNEVALDEGKPQSFNVHTIDASSFPNCPSSQPLAPQKVAAACMTKE